MALNGFDYSVSWSDFTDIPIRPQGVNEDAEIRTHFPHSYDFGSKKKAIIVAKAEVNISTISADCWVVSSKKTDYLLKHEQGHYDIMALGAREFYNKILTLTAADENKLEKKIKDLNAQIQAKVNKVNKRYDSQTNHSLDASMQQTWDKQITGEKQKPAGSIDNLPA